MAKMTGDGIDYFPLDVDLDADDNLSMIIGEFGFKGEFIFIKLLAYIYKNKGYYTAWGEEEQLKFAKRVNYVGASASLINEIVNRSIKWGLFNKSLFDKFNILTSKRIQTTYIQATRKRKGVNINPKYLIEAEEVAKKAERSAVEAEESPKKAEDCDKVKERKVKESKGDEKEKPPPTNDISFKDLSECYDLYLHPSNSRTYEQVCISNFLSLEQLKRLLGEFTEHLTGDGIHQKQFQDYCSHFKRWLAKRPKQTTEPQQSQQQRRNII